jgi:uncharacterized protein
MKKYTGLSILLVISINSHAVWSPEKPNPPRLVNDLAKMLTTTEADALEKKLVDFSNSTSTQLVVITVPSLNGEDKAMVGTEILHKWGVGQKDKDNGIVLLIKPKTPSEKGEVQISTGYGMEAVIPDAIAKRIVENEVIPRFKEGNYYAGIDNALNTIMELSLGEYSAKEYEKKTAPQKGPGSFIVILIILFIIFNIFGRAGKNNKRSIGKNIPFWILLSMMGSGSRHSSSGFGGFSSGGGGFGGFGGGSGGGGGAGGSW